jgi:hypothetical protein
VRATAEWLAALKPGDEVAVRMGGFTRGWVVRVVERRTATQILCVYQDGTAPVRYRADNGRSVGGGRSHHRIEPLTEEIRAELRRERDLSRLRYVRWDEMPDATLRAVCEALDATLGAPR